MEIHLDLKLIVNLFGILKKVWKQYGWEEFVWDDVEFCLRAREAGHDIWVDPKIRIGHEKMKIL